LDPFPCVSAPTISGFFLFAYLPPLRNRRCRRSANPCSLFSPVISITVTSFSLSGIRLTFFHELSPVFLPPPLRWAILNPCPSLFSDRLGSNRHGSPVLSIRENTGQALRRFRSLLLDRTFFILKPWIVCPPPDPRLFVFVSLGFALDRSSLRSFSQPSTVLKWSPICDKHPLIVIHYPSMVKGVYLYDL